MLASEAEAGALAERQEREEHAAWGAWREVVRAMSIGRLTREIFFWRGSWTQIGADYVTGLRGAPSLQRTFAVLDKLDDTDLRRVHVISRMNHRRLEAWARWMAVGFITLPVSIGVTLHELDPATYELIRRRMDAGTMAALALSAVAVVVQMMSAWRAGRIAIAVDLAVVDRGLLRDWPS